MEQKQIIELFLERSEKAIEAAQAKYGTLCHGIAWNLLGSEFSRQFCFRVVTSISFPQVDGRWQYVTEKKLRVVR